MREHVTAARVAEGFSQAGFTSQSSDGGKEGILVFRLYANAGFGLANKFSGVARNAEDNRTAHGQGFEDFGRHDSGEKGVFLQMDEARIRRGEEFGNALLRLAAGQNDVA